MIDFAVFEEDADEARRILEAMSRSATERTGRRCVFSLAPSLDAESITRVMELQADALGDTDVAFTRRDLGEVASDPEALFVRLDVDGRMEGCFFGYWEWPEQVTVPGSDFFLDCGMVSAAYREHDIGRVALSGILLLVDLLECRRIGIATRTDGPRDGELLRLYRRFGFARVVGGRGPDAQMLLALDDARIATYRMDLGLAPDARALPRPGRVWPRADERALLGRFYASLGVAEMMYFVAPFEFAYLYLAMKRPDWAVWVTVSGIVAAALSAIPAGVLADRRSRKLAVIVGGFLTGLGLCAVPWAMTRPGTAQLLASLAAFAVMGVGETLMTGAAEAWVVDNLHHAGRPDLVQTFYGRVHSVSAGGAAIAATMALLILLVVDVDRGLLDLLWIIGGVGFIASAFVSLRIPEHRPSELEEEDIATTSKIREALAAMGRRRSLVYMAIAIVLGGASGAAAQEAFTVSLITKHFDARLFAPLSILDNLIGTVGPIIGIALAHRVGARRMLALVLVLEAVSLAVLFAHGGIAGVLGLYVLLDLLDDSWDPVALARIQSLTPSVHRATISTIVYQAGAIAELAALGAFGLMLGRHREALEKATPDLLEAFSGKVPPAPELPSVWLGLSIADVSIVVFVGMAVVAIPLVLASHKRNATKSAKRLIAPPRSTHAPAPARPAAGSAAGP